MRAYVRRTRDNGTNQPSSLQYSIGCGNPGSGVSLLPWPCNERPGVQSVVITDLSQPRPWPTFGGLPPIKHAETCDGPTRQPFGATLPQGFLHGGGGVYRTSEAYKKGVTHPSPDLALLNSSALAIHN